jgi:hypothetical protein
LAAITMKAVEHQMLGAAIVPEGDSPFRPVEPVAEFWPRDMTD